MGSGCRGWLLNPGAFGSSRLGSRAAPCFQVVVSQALFSFRRNKYIALCLSRRAHSGEQGGLVPPMPRLGALPHPGASPGSVAWYGANNEQGTSSSDPFRSQPGDLPPHGCVGTSATGAKPMSQPAFIISGHQQERGRESEVESHRDKPAVLPPRGDSLPGPCGGKRFPEPGPGGAGAGRAAWVSGKQARG